MTRPMPTTAPPGRPPGTTSTRPHILAAARELFAERGYEQTTIRSLAARARVDPATVMHHFPTKEDLLGHALELPIDPAVLVRDLGREPGTEGETLVRRVLALWEDPDTRLQLTALLRIAVSHETAAAAIRGLFTRELLGPLAERLDGPDAQMRAGLVATQIAGLALLRFIIRVEPVATADHDILVQHVGANLQRYITAGDGHSHDGTQAP